MPPKPIKKLLKKKVTKEPIKKVPKKKVTNEPKKEIEVVNQTKKQSFMDRIDKMNKNTIILGVLSALTILGVGIFGAKQYKDKKYLEMLLSETADLSPSPLHSMQIFERPENVSILSSDPTPTPELYWSDKTGRFSLTKQEKEQEELDRKELLRLDKLKPLRLDKSGDGIKEEESQPLTGSQMHQIDPKLRIVAYHELDRFKTLDQLLGKDKAVCMLYESEYNNGHYVLLLEHANGTLELFDPYGKLDGKGINLDDEIKYSDYSRDHLNGHPPELTQLIKQSGKKLIINHYPFQKMSDSISTCGFHSCARHLLRDLPLQQYAKHFLGHKEPADYLVVKFCDKFKELHNKK